MTGYSVFLRFIISALACFTLAQTFGQQKNIKFSADNIEFDESLGHNARRLLGNVVFEHQGAVMHCDSAYQYPESNSLDAFGKVRINQGDSLYLFTDSLHYDGNERKFYCSYNVRMENDDIELTTDYLVYDRKRKFGFYNGGGRIQNETDRTVLTSQIGYYYPKQAEFFFKNDVVLVNPDYTIEADTLRYRSDIKTTYFLGPTTITSKDSGSIYCEQGYYNSLTKRSEYYQNARIISDDQILEGDTIFYDAETEYGEIRQNVSIVDTAQDLNVLGELAFIFNDRDSAIITGHSELQQFFEEDTMFLHADSFIIYRDSMKDQRIMEAYFHVQFFKSDLQGKCDSLVYDFADSSIKMYNDPILWSDQNQLTGDFIRLNTANGAIHSMNIVSNAFVCSEVDSIRYDQIRGKEMTGYFKESKLRKIFVNGNGQTIYYGLDDDDKFIGVNRGESSDLMILIKENKIDRISFLNDPNATFFPLFDLAPSELKLKGFSWRNHLRPKSRSDIFIWKGPDPAP